MITVVLIIKSAHHDVNFREKDTHSFSFIMSPSISKQGKSFPYWTDRQKKKELIFFAESCLSCQITLHGESYPQLYTINTGKISFQI